MKITFMGLTDSVLSLNSLKLYLHGKETASVEITTDAQRREIQQVLRANLIAIMPRVKEATNNEDKKTSKTTDNLVKTEKTGKSKKIEPVVKRGRGRPKGSTKKAKENVSEKTESSESEVVVSTPSGPVKGNMKRSIISDFPETERTQASLDAMEQLEKEEAEESNKDPEVVDESLLDVADRMGENAVISTGSGVTEVKMKNSVLPESDVIKKRNSFIDKKDSPFIDDAGESTDKIDKNLSDKKDLLGDIIEL